MGTGTTTGEVTITPIFWDPNSSFPTTYTNTITTYLNDIAAASGRTDNVYAINTDYYQVVGGTTSQIQYLLHAGTPIQDTNAYPGPGCAPHPGYTACITDAQVRAELQAQGVGTSLPADAGHMYMVFFPPGVDLTDSTGGYSDGGWCGIHGGYSGSGGPVFYALEPYPPTSGCDGGQAPNGDPAADAQVGTMSHEINESITDPGGPLGQPWFDAAGNEIGDQCNQIFGPALGSTDPNNPQTTLYNQVINGHFYYTQESFSNNSYATFGVGKGCLQTAFVPQGSSGQAPEPMSPNQGLVNASPDVLPADGVSTSTITMSVQDANGDALAGDRVHFGVAARPETPGTCGSLSSDHATTDANGDASVTYTASTANVSCFVIATEATGGSSDVADLYQGTTSEERPSIDSGFPASVTAGAPPVIFTTTVTNPSNRDIPDHRLDLHLSGDNSGSTGLNASQVQLSHADDNTNGQFVPVPLSGTTANDGEITGYVPPEEGSTLPAGGSSVETFKLSLSSDAPTSTATGAPLHTEADADQFNPAADASTNLDYVGPTDVAVLRATAPAAGSPSGTSPPSVSPGAVTNITNQYFGTSNQVAITSLRTDHSGAVTVTGVAGGAGNLAATLTARTIGGASHVAAVRRRKSISYGSGSVAIPGPGPFSVTVQPSSQATKLLRAGRKLRVTAAVTFTPIGGIPSTQTAETTVRTKGRHRKA